MIRPGKLVQGTLRIQGFSFLPRQVVRGYRQTQTLATWSRGFGRHKIGNFSVTAVAGVCQGLAEPLARKIKFHGHCRLCAMYACGPGSTTGIQGMITWYWGGNTGILWCQWVVSKSKLACRYKWEISHFLETAPLQWLSNAEGPFCIHLCTEPHKEPSAVIHWSDPTPWSQLQQWPTSLVLSDSLNQRKSTSKYFLRESDYLDYLDF